MQKSSRLETKGAKMKKRLVTMTVVALESGTKYILEPEMGQSEADQRVEKIDGKGGDRRYQDHTPLLPRQERSPHW